MGPIGFAGAKGEIGATGPAGPTLFKRSSFAFVVVGTVNTQLTGMTFTSPVSGAAVLRGRGYCNITGGGEIYNDVLISTGPNLASALLGNISTFGVMNVPIGTSQTVHQRMWTSEQALPVIGGEPIIAVLAARKAGTPLVNCTGTLQVEVFTGELP
jgi:hypothetical protein